MSHNNVTGDSSTQGVGVYDIMMRITNLFDIDKPLLGALHCSAHARLNEGLSCSCCVFSSDVMSKRVLALVLVLIYGISICAFGE